MNELMKILIACDGSTCAEDAVNDLPRAGMPRQADALIVYIHESWLPSASYEIAGSVSVSAISAAAQPARDMRVEAQHALFKGEHAAMLEKAAARLKSYFPEWRTKTLNLQGSPAREIIRRAQDWNAGLIVVGAHGRHEIKRLALGSVSQKIVNEATCSVRVVRGESWKNGSPSRLLIGLDGTSASKAAVAEVAGRMWITGGEVRLIIARDSPEKNSERLREYVEDARRILERAELSVTELIEEGDPKQIIVQAAEEWGADCIFLGANNPQNSPENQLLGSVSTAIVARAHCTVEIVRQRQPERN